MELNNIVLVLVGLAILWFIWKSRLKSRTPEAQYEAAELQSATDEALAGLPDGWNLSAPDRERFGAGSDGVVVYGVVATGPDGRGVLGLALSKAEALRAAADAARGDLPLTDAWAPPVSDLTSATADTPPDAEARLPMGWTLIALDHERFSMVGDPVSTYGAMAVGPGGQRALAVARDRATALERLVGRIGGRLPISDVGGLRVDAGNAGI